MGLEVLLEPSYKVFLLPVRQVTCLSGSARIMLAGPMTQQQQHMHQQQHCCEF
jgi:hypothetical protein